MDAHAYIYTCIHMYALYLFRVRNIVDFVQDVHLSSFPVTYAITLVYNSASLVQLSLANMCVLQTIQNVSSSKIAIESNVLRSIQLIVQNSRENRGCHKCKNFVQKFFKFQTKTPPKPPSTRANVQTETNEEWRCRKEYMLRLQREKHLWKSFSHHKQKSSVSCAALRTDFMEKDFAHRRRGCSC